MSSTTPNLNLFKWDPTADKKSTFNIDTCMNDNWDKLDTAVSNISIESKTYAELKTLKDNNQLKQGKKYLLTDYKTKYQQPTTLTIKEMAIEQLVLTANSTNSFEPIVSSPTYPQDIIQYNFNDNVCEDTTTPRTGFIQRRTDTITKNDCPQDWRTMLWARYKPDDTRYYYNGNLTQMQLLPVSSVSVSGYLYKYENSLYISKTTGIPTIPTDPSIFYRVYEDINVGMLMEEKTKIADKVELKKGELHERLTFGNSCYRNYIGEITARGHNNVLGSSCANINLGLANYDNTLGNSCTVNSFGDNSYKNIMMNNCIANSIGAYCGQNIIGNSCVSNSFGNNSDRNILSYSCANNSFGNDCNENILTTTCDCNSFGNKCYSNTLASNCTSNSFGNECYSNVFGNSCVTNSFGNRCNNNVFGNSCNGNIIGNSSSQNTCGHYFGGNIFGSSCVLNKFGDSCSFNTFHNGCSANTLLSNFSHLFVKELYDKNITNISGLKGISYNNTIEKNSNSQYVYWFLNSSNQPIYTVIP